MRIPTSRPGQTCLGVVIAIPEPHCAVLRDARSAAGDRLAESIPPHITLVPPTLVADSSVSRVVEHVRSRVSQRAPFRLLLRGTGTFRPKSPVVFVQVAQGIVECEQMEEAMRTRELAQDLRFRYHPHVTIAQDIDDAALDRAFDAMSGFEAEFQVREVSVCRLTDDVRLDTLQVLRLGG